MRRERGVVYTRARVYNNIELGVSSFFQSEQHNTLYRLTRLALLLANRKHFVRVLSWKIGTTEHRIVYLWPGTACVEMTSQARTLISGLFVKIRK